MDAALNRKSMMIGVPGLVIQTIGVVTHTMVSPLLVLGGTALLVVGLCFYAMAKGHHWAWGFVGLLSCIGIVVLGVMPDRAPALPPPSPQR